MPVPSHRNLEMYREVTRPLGCLEQPASAGEPLAAIVEVIYRVIYHTRPMFVMNVKPSPTGIDIQRPSFSFRLD